MSELNRNYRVEAGAYGLKMIEVTGRCTETERTRIEGNCTHRYELVPLPNASGAILKSLDGTTPRVVDVRPETFMGRPYQCVKIEGVCTPLAPEQDGGRWTGHAILSFLMRYQEVGGVA